MKYAAILSLAGLLMATSASAEEQTISIPGEGWKIRLDAPKLTPSKGDANIGMMTFQSSPLLGYQ